jgi:hypothetical protein
LTVTLAVSARRVAGWLLAAVLVLSLSSAAGQLSKYVFGHGRLGGLVPLLYVGSVRSLPTWLASSMLLLAALLAWALAGGTGSAHWRGLALVLLVLAVNRALGVGDLVARTFGLVPPARVAAGWLAALGLVLALGRFVLGLPRRTRRLVIAAGALWAAGGLVLETVFGSGAAHRPLHWRETPLLALLTSVEGGLELVAIVVLVYALLVQLDGEVRVRVDATVARRRRLG